MSGVKSTPTLLRRTCSLRCVHACVNCAYVIATGYRGEYLTYTHYTYVPSNFTNTYIYMYVRVSDKAAICTLMVHCMVDTDLLYVLNIHTCMHACSIFHNILCVYCVLFALSTL